MLRRMIRRYTRAEYTARIRRLLAARPDMTVSTDVIVGFPGETEADFQQTLDVVAEVGFVGLFGFKYSPRPYTPALKLGDDVTEEEKSERLARLFDLAESQTRAHLATLVGTHQEVLVEGTGKTPGLWTGRTRRNEIVHLDDVPGKSLTGELVTVAITQAFKHSLAGTVTADAAAALPLVGRPAVPAKKRALPLVL
jgi:tRNA-2-methylthio-N6-dimethylallyladenosine synthase